MEQEGMLARLTVSRALDAFPCKTPAQSQRKNANLVLRESGLFPNEIE